MRGTYLVLVAFLLMLFNLKKADAAVGGPTVNDRNVIPLYTPTFKDSKFIEYNFEIGQKILSEIIIQYQNVEISKALIEQYAWNNLKKNEIFNLKEATQNIKNINSLSGISAMGKLEAIDSNKVRLLITLKATKKNNGNFTLNNSGSKNSGYLKGTGSYNFNNYLGHGETIGLKQVHTESNGTNYYEINSSKPFDTDGSKLKFRAARMRYKLDHYFEGRGYEGWSNFVDLNYEKPFIYEDKFNLNLGAGLWRSQFRVDERSGGLKGESTVIHKINFSAEGNVKDNLFKEATTNFRVVYGIGKVQLADDADFSPTNDEAGVRGYFSKINPAFARREKITENTDLIFKMKGQYAFQNLEGSEEFTLGGFFNVRSYPNNQAGGDSGYISTLELERTITKDLKVSMLYDYGRIWINHKRYSGSAGNNNYNLQNGGLILDWNFLPGTNMKIMYIDRLGTINEGRRADGTDFDRSYHPQKFLFSISRNF